MYTYMCAVDTYALDLVIRATLQRDVLLIKLFCLLFLKQKKFLCQLFWCG